MIHTKVGRYILTILLALDELINAIFGGYAGETISYRFAFNAQMGKISGCIFCKIIEYFLPDHCSLETPSKADRLSRGSIYIDTKGEI